MMQINIIMNVCLCVSMPPSVGEKHVSSYTMVASLLPKCEDGGGKAKVGWLSIAGSAV